MAIGAAALVGSLVFGAVGTGIQYSASKKAEQAQQEALKFQAQAENTRERASEIDANRKRRNMVREAIIAKSTAQSNATGANAEFGSALPGAYGQIAGQTAYNIAGVGTQQQLGAELFAYNRGVLGARRNEASAQSQSSFGSGISSLGGAFGKSLGSLDRVSGGWFS